MTVDLKTLEIGDTIAVDLTVNAISENGSVYTKEGPAFHHGALECIKKITKPAFDWDDVKPGMAFFLDGDIVIFFIADDPTDTYSAIFSDRFDGSVDESNVVFRAFNGLRRATKHDLPCVKGEEG